jgi:hypothetical protein
MTYVFIRDANHHRFLYACLPINGNHMSEGHSAPSLLITTAFD